MHRNDKLRIENAVMCEVRYARIRNGILSKVPPGIRIQNFRVVRKYRFLRRDVMRGFQNSAAKSCIPLSWRTVMQQHGKIKSSTPMASMQRLTLGRETVAFGEKTKPPALVAECHRALKTLN